MDKNGGSRHIHGNVWYSFWSLEYVSDLRIIMVTIDQGGPLWQSNVVEALTWGRKNILTYKFLLFSCNQKRFTNTINAPVVNPSLAYSFERNRLYSCRFVRMTARFFSVYYVYLRAEHAGAAALHMLFWTPDISFNINLGLTNPGAKNLHFLVENRH